jgi:uncharacterized protein (TIGR04168 family)
MASPPPVAPKLAVIGDVHLHWNECDVDYFNRSDYDLILFVGDIAAYRHRTALSTARAMAALNKPAIVIPGNHDAVHLGQLIAEVLERPRIADTLSAGHRRRHRQLDRAFGGVTMAGYSRHLVTLRGQRYSIIAGRPHSMGGPRVAFRRQLRGVYGVDCLDGSARRLIELVEQCDGEPIVFLAHNGPSGFGARRDDIWGCDFRRDEGDFGDPDLTLAIDHARRSGRRVLAVVAGHMHHRLKGGGQRRWLEERGDTIYVNAARVPRIYRQDGEIRHHHIELTLHRGGAGVAERLVTGGPPGGFSLKSGASGQ